METKIEARTRNRIPRRLRAGEQFGPKFAEYQVSDKQLKAIQGDPHLEVKAGDAEPVGLEGSAKELIETAGRTNDAEMLTAWLETEKATKKRKTVIDAIEAGLARIAAA